MSRDSSTEVFYKLVGLRTSGLACLTAMGGVYMLHPVLAVVSLYHTTVTIPSYMPMLQSAFRPANIIAGGHLANACHICMTCLVDAISA